MTLHIRGGIGGSPRALPIPRITERRLDMNEKIGPKWDDIPPAAFVGHLLTEELSRHYPEVVSILRQDTELRDDLIGFLLRLPAAGASSGQEYALPAAVQRLMLERLQHGVVDWFSQLMDRFRASAGSQLAASIGRYQELLPALARSSPEATMTIEVCGSETPIVRSRSKTTAPKMTMPNSDTLRLVSGLEMELESSRQTIVQTAVIDCRLKDAPEALRAFHAFIQWFAVLAREETRDHFVMPKGSVDLIWHAFVLHTKLYRQLCHRYLGFYLDHEPRPGPPTPEAVQATVRLLAEHYGPSLSPLLAAWSPTTIGL